MNTTLLSTRDRQCTIDPEVLTIEAGRSYVAGNYYSS